jgi:hypothetical protein
MVTAVFILILLTVAASLASWLFGQWRARGTRISSIAFAMGGGGTVLLIGSVALVIFTATNEWRRLVPTQDFSPMIAPAPAPDRDTIETAPLAHQPASPTPLEAHQPEIAAEPVVIAEPELALAPPAERPVERIRRATFAEPKESMLALAEQLLEQSDYDAAIDLARKYLAAQPYDAEMSSILARSLFAAEYPGSRSTAPALLANRDWPLTDCVVPTYSGDSTLWLLENVCGRIVAVAFESCELGEVECRLRRSDSRAWHSEPTGIVMSTLNDKPVALRVGDHGPLVAPIFTIRDVAGVRRQIRYLACEVTSRDVLRLLTDSGNDELAQQRLTAALRDDQCYSQVLRQASGGEWLATQSTGNQQ